MNNGKKYCGKENRKSKVSLCAIEMARKVLLKNTGPLTLRRFCSALLPPFNGTLDLAKLASSPLEELRRRSEGRELCDGDGNRIKGAPWGMSLAHNTASAAEPWPTVRTVGFLRVTPECFTFLLRRRKQHTSTNSAFFAFGKQQIS